MTAHRENRIVPYTADLMYRVVADIEQYPAFLPWVAALRVLSRVQEQEGEIVIAEMAVGFGALRERYTSRVALDPVARRIDVAAIKGPFKTLENHWRFIPDGEHSRIDFALAFEFRNRLLQTAAGAAFGKVLLKMTDAFESRAAQLSRVGE